MVWRAPLLAFFVAVGAFQPGALVLRIHAAVGESLILSEVRAMDASGNIVAHSQALLDPNTGMAAYCFDNDLSTSCSAAAPGVPLEVEFAPGTQLARLQVINHPDSASWARIDGGNISLEVVPNRIWEGSFAGAVPTFDFWTSEPPFPDGTVVLRIQTDGTSGQLLNLAEVIVEDASGTVTPAHALLDPYWVDPGSKSSFPPELCVDGRWDTYCRGATEGAALRLVFPAGTEISRVLVINRLDDAKKGRIANGLISLEVQPNTIWQATFQGGEDNYEFYPNGPPLFEDGAVVLTIQKDGEFLNLAELKAYDAAGNVLVPSRLRLDPFRIETGTMASYPASNCFDGDKFTVCESSKAGAPFQVEFPAGTEIARIFVVNCLTMPCDQRIENAKISLEVVPNKTWEGTFLGAEVNYDFVIADYQDGAVVLRIQKDGGIPNFSELQIYDASGAILPHSRLRLNPYWTSRTTSDSSPPENCFDGRLQTLCATSKAGTPLEVEFPPGTEIARVRAVNRLDDDRFTSRNENAEISVEVVPGNIVWSSTFVGTENVYEFFTTLPIFSDGAVVVKIQPPQSGFLNLADVIAYDMSGRMIPYVKAIMQPYWFTNRNTANPIGQPPEACLDGDWSTICIGGAVDVPLHIEYPAGSEIAHVRVVNRLQVFQERIVNGKISLEVVPNVTWESTFEELADNYDFFTSSPLFKDGSVVLKIQTAGQLLHLMEVLAYDVSGSPINHTKVVMSPWRIDDASGVPSGLPPENCVDGDQSTMCHSGGLDDPLYIEYPSDVAFIRVFNRLDSVNWRIENADISLAHTPNTVWQEKFLGVKDTYDFWPRQPLLLRIQTAARGVESFDFLNLGEVLVYGESGEKLQHLSADLDPVYGHHVAELCFDGDYDTVCHSGASNPLEVRFPPAATVGSIRIINRRSGRYDRMDGASVTLQRGSEMIWQGTLVGSGAEWFFNLMNTTTTTSTLSTSSSTSSSLSSSTSTTSSSSTSSTTSSSSSATSSSSSSSSLTDTSTTSATTTTVTGTTVTSSTSSSTNTVTITSSTSSSTTSSTSTTRTSSATTTSSTSTSTVSGTSTTSSSSSTTSSTASTSMTSTSTDTFSSTTSATTTISTSSTSTRTETFSSTTSATTTISASSTSTRTESATRTATFSTTSSSATSSSSVSTSSTFSMTSTTGTSTTSRTMSSTSTSSTGTSSTTSSHTSRTSTTTATAASAPLASSSTSTSSVTTSLTAPLAEVFVEIMSFARAGEMTTTSSVTETPLASTVSTSSENTRTTLPPTKEEEASAEVDLAADEAIKKLQESNVTVQSTTSRTGAVISVVRLFQASKAVLPGKNDSSSPTSSNATSSSDVVVVKVDHGIVEEKITVRIPTATFAAIAPSTEEDDEAILVVSPINLSALLPHSPSDPQKKPLEPPKPPEPGQRLAVGDAGTVESNVPLAAMKIDLRYLRAGDVITVEQLEEPIVFTIPSVKYVAGMSCLFYDEGLNAWSGEGTGVADENVEGDVLVCWTMHLTLFGAFIQGFADVFLCAQLHLFTPEAMRKIFTSQWCWKPGACVLWASIGLLLVTFAVSMFIDRRRSRSMTWCDEFFLIPLGPVPNEEDGERRLSTVDYVRGRSSRASTGSESPREEQPRCWKGALSGPLFSAGALVCSPLLHRCSGCHGTVAVWDAVDDVASEWFESFGELRSFVEGLMKGFEVGGAGTSGGGRSSRTFLACHGLMCTLTLLTSRRLAGSRMGLSDDVVTFVLQDKELAKCLVDHHRTTDLRLARSVSWHVLEGREAVWVRLHDEVCSQLQQAITKHETWSHLPVSVAKLFFMHSPFGGMWSYSIFMTCKMRAFFFAIDVIGAFLLCAVFFQGAGGVTSVENESDEECEGGADDDVAYAFGRVIAIGLGSAFVSGLPVKALNSLHHRRIKHFDYEGCPDWKRQVKAWAIEDRFLWLLGSCYLAFGALFVMLFLANISEEDHEDFSRSEVIAVVQTCLILPMALAVCVPGLATLFIFLAGKLGRQGRTALLVDVQHRLHRNTNAMLPMMQV